MALSRIVTPMQGVTLKYFHPTHRNRPPPLSGERSISYLLINFP